jgi:hypothetical protein
MVPGLTTGDGHVRSNTIANDRQAYREIRSRCGALREMAHGRFLLQSTPLKLWRSRIGEFGAGRAHKSKAWWPEA